MTHSGISVHVLTNDHASDLRRLDAETSVNELSRIKAIPQCGVRNCNAWIGYRDGVPASYIAVEYDEELSSYLGDKVALFTDFRSRDDACVVSAVVEEVVAWMKNIGVTALRGPMSRSVSEVRGALVEGYELPPCLGLAQNPKYYDELLRSAGLEKAMDMFSYSVRTENLEKVTRVAKLAKLRNPGLSIRNFDLKHSDREIGSIVDLYNSAWKGHWSFLPVTKEDFTNALDSMAAFFDPEMVKIASIGTRDVGVMVSVPNVLDKEVRDTGRPISARAMLFGVDKAYQKRGIDALLMYSAVNMAKNKSIRTYEVGWVLESNTIWRNQLESACGAAMVGRRRYRLYEWSVGDG